MVPSCSLSGAHAWNAFCLPPVKKLCPERRPSGTATPRQLAAAPAAKFAGPPKHCSAGRIPISAVQAALARPASLNAARRSIFGIYVWPATEGPARGKMTRWELWAPGPGEGWKVGWESGRSTGRHAER